MMKKERADSAGRIESIKSTYQSCKREAFMLCFAAVGSTRAARKLLCESFYTAGITERRAARFAAGKRRIEEKKADAGTAAAETQAETGRNGKKLSDAEARALRATAKKAGKARAVHPLVEGCSDSAAAFLTRVSSALAPTEEQAWALVKMGGVSVAEAAEILSLKEPETAGYIKVAGDKLNAAFPSLTEDETESRYTSAMTEASDGGEVWGTVSFMLERRFTVNSRISRAALAVAAVLLLALCGFFGSVLVRSTVGIKYDDTVITADPSSEDYWRRGVRVQSSEHPNITVSLMTALEPLADNDTLRVNFVFYDRAAMLSATYQGYDLESLYAELYETGTRQGSINRFIAKAICQYYANYEKPFLPKLREKDFVSDYDSIYDCALSLAGELAAAGSTASKELVDACPEVFGSREAFDSYLYSELFRSQVYDINELLLNEKYIQQYYSGESDFSEEEYAELRLSYESSIYAFDEVLGRNITGVSSCALGGKQLNSFESVRYKLGAELEAKLFDVCLGVLGSGCGLRADGCEYADISAYSADLTKSEIIRLADEDGRFSFLGLAVPEISNGKPEDLDRYLAALITLHGESGKKYDIYKVDSVYQQHGINYMVPRTLPEGFIEELRGKLNCRYTAFEQLAGYNYTMLYGHSFTWTGGQILRRAFGVRDYGIYSADFKSFYIRVEPNTYY